MMLTFEPEEVGYDPSEKLMRFCAADGPFPVRCGVAAEVLRGTPGQCLGGRRDDARHLSAPEEAHSGHPGAEIWCGTVGARRPRDRSSRRFEGPRIGLRACNPGVRLLAAAEGGPCRMPPLPPRGSLGGLNAGNYYRAGQAPVGILSTSSEIHPGRKEAPWTDMPADDWRWIRSSGSWPAVPRGLACPDSAVTCGTTRREERAPDRGPEFIFGGIVFASAAGGPSRIVERGRAAGVIRPAARMSGPGGRRSRGPGTSDRPAIEVRRASAYRQ